MRGYAAHRRELGLPGSSHVAVGNAVRDGRLVASVSQDERGRYHIDPELADSEWEAATNPSKQREPAPGPVRGAQALTGDLFGPPEGDDPFDRRPGYGRPSGNEYREALTKQARHRAELLELDVRQRGGELVPWAPTVEAVETLARMTRDRVMQVVDRLSAQLAATNKEKEIRQMVYEELDRAFNEAAEQVRTFRETREVDQ